MSCALREALLRVGGPRLASLLQLLAVIWLPLAPACGGPVAARAPVTQSDGRYVMGTVLEITLVAPDAAEGRAALDESFTLAQQLGAALTTWDPDSELSRLNREAGSGPRPVSRELARVIELSLRYAERTGGSFDVTVGPLVELWKQAGARGKLPSAAELDAARAKVGVRGIELQSGEKVGLRAGVSLNLGAVAKGYALDRVREQLTRRGIGNALLSFGQSSSWALGRPTDAPGWRLLARGPDDDLLGVLTLEDQALSVSGSLGQWTEIEGRRYGHVIDPRSGQPLTRRRQALVVAADASLAEALSTALLVQGEAGLPMLEAQPGCEALLAEAGGRSWRTTGWDAATRFEELADPD